MGEHSHARVVWPHDGRTFPFGPRPLRVLVHADSGDGGFAVFESAPEPGGTVPPPHRYHAHAQRMGGLRFPTTPDGPLMNNRTELAALPMARMRETCRP